MTTRPEPPSGKQFELRLGDDVATVVEVGGALRQYQKAGVDLLDGYGEQEWCTGARGQTLAPWPNRIRDGKYEFRGHAEQVPLNEPKKRNALHGMVRWENWSVQEQTPTSIQLSYLLHAVPGYRFTLQVINRYRLSDAGLEVETEAVNVGHATCPYGAGAHPYLNVGCLLDDALVLAPGRVRLPTDERGIPVGTEAVDGTPYDFRRPTPLRGLKVDHAFTDLIRDPQGRAWVHLSNLGRTRSVSLWLDETYRYVELFTGDALSDARYRRTGLGVEPMTCPPNAFQTGQDVRALEPGERMVSRWGIVAGTLPTSAQY